MGVCPNETVAGGPGHLGVDLCSRSLLDSTYFAHRWCGRGNGGAIWCLHFVGCKYHPVADGGSGFFSLLCLLRECKMGFKVVSERCLWEQVLLGIRAVSGRIRAEGQ